MKNNMNITGIEPAYNMETDNNSTSMQTTIRQAGNNTGTTATQPTHHSIISVKAVNKQKIVRNQTEIKPKNRLKTDRNQAENRLKTGRRSKTSRRLQEQADIINKDVTVLWYGNNTGIQTRKNRQKIRNIKKTARTGRHY